MTPRRYETPEAFKQALEARLRQLSGDGVDMARRRQRLVFDRLLARLFMGFGEAVVLKGGLAIEARLSECRTTRDVDLRLESRPEDLLQRLRSFGGRALGDFMNFEVEADDAQPEIEAEGLRYGGQRFRVTCFIAGKVYAAPFGLDVAYGDALCGEPEVLSGDDDLSFAGVPPPTIRVYPLLSHVAEKLHAYTLPRVSTNSRVKDLPDLALLATVREIDAERLREAVATTFRFRGTHAPPAALPEPPPSWAAAYAAMAKGGRLPWGTLPAVFAAARGFLDPVLGSREAAVWSPGRWTWRPKA